MIHYFLDDANDEESIASCLLPEIIQAKRSNITPDLPTASDHESDHEPFLTDISDEDAPLREVC